MIMVFVVDFIVYMFMEKLHLDVISQESHVTQTVLSNIKLNHIL